MRISRALGRLRTQLAAIVAAALLPAGVLAIVQAVSSAEQQADQRLALLESEARVRATEERDLLLDVQASLRAAAREVEAELEETGGCAGTFATLADGHRWLTRAIVLDRAGNAVCGTDVPLTVAGTDEWEREFLPAPRFVVGPSREAWLAEEPVLTAYYPLPDADPRAYALAVGVRVASLRTIAEAKRDPDTPFTLLGDDGDVLLWRESDPAGWVPNGRDELTGFLTRVVEREGLDGDLRTYIVHPLILGEVWAMTGAPVPTAGEILIGPQGVAIAVPVLLWLIATGVAFVAIDRLVTRHVRALEKVARRIGQGELDIKVDSFRTAPTEIRRLGEAIGRMAGNLADREATLREVLGTQKSLLLEVHHRVKNNLQMISSLMNIQLRRVGHGVERHLLQMVQDRIHGLALVHQNLYATERLDHVALDHLVRDLCDHLATSLGPAGGEVRIENRLEPVVVDAAVATPVALFLTEALGNVFKHGVTPGRPALVTVSLEGAEGRFRLTVENARHDGPPPRVDRNAGLGTRLMEGFARQLGGDMRIDEHPERFSVTLTAAVRERGGGDFAIREARSA